MVTTPAELFDLRDRVAVVTGGSRGLGREMVRAFAAAGASVVIASRKLDACEELAAEVEKETGRPALAVAAHMGRWQDCDRLADAAYERFGHVDVLVNNAGMSPLYPDLVSVTEDLFDKVVAVNLKGPFRLASLIGSRMAEAGRGSIINVSTTGSIRPTWKELPYASAKAGLNAFTVGLANALAPNVRVNGILPGPFATDIADAWPEEDRAGAWHPMGRIGRPHEIVGAALYLASDASSFTSGALLRVDGGVTQST